MTYHGSIRRYLLAGIAVTGALVFGVGGWAAVTEISGAVIASGTLAVDSRVKEVQHQTGGIIAEIHARDGDRVQGGDVLVLLDETMARANLAIVTKGLDELMARRGRLLAERDDAKKVEFAVELLERHDEPEVSHLVASERRLFELRRTARLGLKSQLEARLGQLAKEIEGYSAQLSAKSQEIELVNRELEGARELWKKKLTPIAKLTEIERTATRIEGERGQLIATIAQSEGRIAETELQRLQIDLDFSREVGKELREVDSQYGEFVERKVAAEDQFRRLVIRAPQDGTVHESLVHTVGGVIPPGRTIMSIVPSSDKLIVDAKVAPQDIDQLALGQPALLRFSAFNQRTTPEIIGAISRISADITTIERTGESHYTVGITIAPEEIVRLGDVRLIPGMPVEAFFKTHDRRVISYLMKPLHDQIARAFRER